MSRSNALAGWKDPAPVTLAAEEVPSGQPVDLFEVLLDEVGAEAWVRFRFLAPEIGGQNGDVSFVQTQLDFQYLCEDVALRYLRDFDLQADVVVISLLDRPVEFGQTDPDATQYIEAFRVADGVCALEELW